MFKSTKKTELIKQQAQLWLRYLKPNQRVLCAEAKDQWGPNRPGDRLLSQTSTPNNNFINQVAALQLVVCSLPDGSVTNSAPPPARHLFINDTKRSMTKSPY